MQAIASGLASLGRGEDSMLVHMTPKEVHALQGLAALKGASLTTNPHTGLPEAGILSSVLPMLAGAAVTAMSGGAAAPWMAALAGGATGMAVNGGSLQSGVMGALGGYGGGSLYSGFVAPGAGTYAPVVDAQPSLLSNAADTQAANLQSFATDQPSFVDPTGAATQAGLSGLPGMSSPYVTGTSEVLPTIPGAQSYEQIAQQDAAQAAAQPTAAQQAIANTPAAPTAPTVRTEIGGSGNAVDSGLNAARSGTNWDPSYVGTSSSGPATPYASVAPPKNGLAGLWDKISNPDTYYANGKITMPGYAALGGGALLMSKLANNSAMKQQAELNRHNNVYLPGSDYQNMARATGWRGAAGGIAGDYPNRSPEREVVTPGIEPRTDPFTGQLPAPQTMAGGGIAGHPRYLQGGGDGMSDSIPAHIDGKQPAALATSEFVVPADVVSHLGNGSSEAGAKHLYSMMDRIRKARTGNTRQGKQINANKFLPA